MRLLGSFHPIHGVAPKCLHLYQQTLHIQLDQEATYTHGFSALTPLGEVDDRTFT
jgi:hypothetical protein